MAALVQGRKAKSEDPLGSRGQAEALIYFINPRMLLLVKELKHAHEPERGLSFMRQMLPWPGSSMQLQLGGRLSLRVTTCLAGWREAR